MPADTDNRAPVDFAALDTVAASEKPYRLQLRHPGTGALMDAYIHHVGKDADIIRQYNNEKKDERINAIVKAQRAGEDAPIILSEQSDEIALGLIVAATTAFENIYIGGQLVVFSHAAAFDFYRRFRWARDQVDASIAKMENFMIG